MIPEEADTQVPWSLECGVEILSNTREEGQRGKPRQNLREFPNQYLY